jgi:hypothetical protein
MERLSNITAAARLFRPSRCAQRSGKISVVTTLGVLGLIIMAGYVGNVGNSVATKLQSQNAADAVTFSSAQWMARGMNAVTATNHLLGEATGLVVTIEAFGGPELDVGLSDYPDVVKTVDNLNRELINIAAINGLPVYGVTPFLTELDREFLNFTVKGVISPDDERKTFRAFATIYDAKYTLKQATLVAMLSKVVGNVLLFVPPPFGFATAPAGFALHAVATATITKASQEYLVLEGLQAVAFGMIPIKKTFEELVIPGLAAHGDFVAGKNGPVGGAIEAECKRLGESYSIVAEVFPKPDDLRLPLEAEPAPSGQGTSQDEPEWGKDDNFPLPSADDIKDKFPDDFDFNEAINGSQKRIKETEAQITALDALNVRADAQLKGNPTPEERTKLENEKQQLATLRSELVTKRDKLKEETAAAIEEKNKFDNLLGGLGLDAFGPGSGNISAKPQHLAKQQMKQSEERYTQWVRATYPYVDSYRAAILGLAGDNPLTSLLGLSKFGEYYVKWTNRYTLTNAWKFRSGNRFQGSGKSGRYTKQGIPLKMYVMIDAYKGGGDRKDQKGHENWTSSSEQAKQKAEELFTIFGVTQRTKQTIFSPKLYSRKPTDSVTTFSQAIFYNANKQSPAPIGAKDTRQAVLGWDTLNWNPATPAPEWGAKARDDGEGWPWEIFEKGSGLKPTAETRLNWQAKLMPVTETRFEKALDGGFENQNMTDDLTKARQFFKQLVTH